MKHQGWSPDRLRELGADLPRECTDRLIAYEDLLLTKGAALGVIAAGDVGRLRERHLEDSLRAWPLLGGARTAADLGSGGGLPGMVLAIARPEISFTLAEVRRHRAAFLADAVSQLALPNVIIHPRRVQTLRVRVDVALARAFAPARRSWAAADPLLGPDGRLIYWAGSGFDPASEAPFGVGLRLFRTPSLARSGPLAIMTRQ